MIETTRDDLVTALDGFYLSVRNHRGYQESGQIAHPDEVADALHATLSRIAAESRPDRAVDTGVSMIAAERARQVAAEGYTPGHDAEHGNGELAEAAVAYALAANGDGAYREFWPFRVADFKFTGPVRSLVKAGALIAAEIDRIVAAGDLENGAPCCSGCGDGCGCGGPPHEDISDKEDGSDGH